MAVFSVNQATQFYVGSTQKVSNDTDVALQIKNAQGQVIDITDRIKEGCLLYSETKAISELNIKAPAPKITVQAPVAGAEYLVRLTISTEGGPQYAYYKTVGIVAAPSGETNTTLATKIKTALEKASKRDVAGEYYQASDDGKGVVTISPKLVSSVGKRYVIPTIEVSVSEITGKDTAFDATKWTAASDNVNTASVTGSGMAKLKDLEYFCAGEKGDVYRGAMWPNEIPFVSKLTGSETHVHTIHYYEDLGNEAAQKSEKTIVIVNSSSTDPLA